MANINSCHIFMDGNKRLVITIDNPNAEMLEKARRIVDEVVLQVDNLEAPPPPVNEVEKKKVPFVDLSAIAKGGDFKGQTLGWIYDNQFDYLAYTISLKPEMLDRFLVTKEDFVEKAKASAQSSSVSLERIVDMVKSAGALVDDLIVKMGKNSISELNSTESEEMILFIERFLEERRYQLDGTAE